MTNTVTQDVPVLSDLGQSVLQDVELAAYVQQETAEQALAGDVHQTGSCHGYHLVRVNEHERSRARIVERYPRPVREVPLGEIHEKGREEYRDDRCAHEGQISQRVAPVEHIECVESRIFLVQ